MIKLTWNNFKPSKALYGSVILNLKYLDRVNYGVFRSFQNFSSNYQFIQYSVNLIEVKHDVQFANVPEILVQGLHKQVNQLKIALKLLPSGVVHCRWRRYKLRNRARRISYKQSWSCAANLSPTNYLKEIGLFGISHHDHSVDLRL